MGFVVCVQKCRYLDTRLVAQFDATNEKTFRK